VHAWERKENLPPCAIQVITGTPKISPTLSWILLHSLLRLNTPVSNKSALTRGKTLPEGIYTIQWAAKVLRAVAEKYGYSNLNISGQGQDIAVLLTLLDSSCFLVLVLKRSLN
jgi:hypothetical protein